MGEVEGFQSICPINSLEIIQSFFLPNYLTSQMLTLKEGMKLAAGRA